MAQAGAVVGCLLQNDLNDNQVLVALSTPDVATNSDAETQTQSLILKLESLICPSIDGSQLRNRVLVDSEV